LQGFRLEGLNLHVPRANRYILPGHVYHLTHRCHNREFLLRFAVHRNAYREQLRRAVREFDLSLLDYSITSNHTHLLAFAEDDAQISGFVHQADGQFAQRYNRLKKRSGAFWEDRFHSTMVDSGEYLFECLKYIELNMVRCGVVRHPSQWQWSGYSELMGLRSRWRLLDVDCLLKLLRTDDLASFRNNFNAALELAIQRGEMKRQPCWTESIAVGSESYVREIECRVNRQRIEVKREGQAWILRERSESELYGTKPHGPLERENGVENCMQGQFQHPFCAESTASVRFTQVRPRRH
jgi:putative transposase